MLSSLSRPVSTRCVGQKLGLVVCHYFGEQRLLAIRRHHDHLSGHTVPSGTCARVRTTHRVAGTALRRNRSDAAAPLRFGQIMTNGGTR